MTQNTS